MAAEAAALAALEAFAAKEEVATLYKRTYPSFVFAILKEYIRETMGGVTLNPRLRRWRRLQQRRKWLPHIHTLLYIRYTYVILYIRETRTGGG